MNGQELAVALQQVGTWCNHDRPHDHLRGRTPAEGWAGIDIFAPEAKTERNIHPQESG